MIRLSGCLSILIVARAWLVLVMGVRLIRVVFPWLVPKRPVVIIGVACEYLFLNLMSRHAVPVPSFLRDSPTC